MLAYVRAMPLKDFLARNGRFLLFGLSLVLSPAQIHAENSVQVTIVEEDGKTPLPGATVKWTRYPNPKPIQLTTDQAGQCMLPVPNDGATGFRALVSHAGYVPRFVDWNTRHPEFHLPKKFILPIDKARTIGGFVTDEDGKPIAQATVRLIIRGSSSGLSQEIHDDIWEAKSTTDEQGRWTFDGAPASLKYLSARLSHPRYFDSDGTRQDIKPEEYFAKTARFVMNAGRLIKGTVRDEKGTPLEGVSVLMNEHGVGSVTEPSFTTDASGHYLIENAPKQSPYVMKQGVLLTFFKKGFAPEMKMVNTKAGPATIDVVLPPGHLLTGRVVDAEGKPIEGARVAPNYWRKFRPFCGQRFKTNADGRFTWEDAPEDEVVFDILKENYTSMRKVSLKAGTDATLTLKRPLTASATVVDEETGAPVPAFTIEPGVQWSDGRKSLARSAKLTGKDGKFQWTFDEPVKLAGADGKTVDEGRHILRVQAPGYTIADSRPIRDTEESVQLEYKLKKGGDSKILVLTKDGNPAAGAIVAVAGEGNSIQVTDGKIRGDDSWTTATADESGTASLPAMEGNPSLVVAHPDLGFAEISLTDARASGVKLSPWGRVVVNSAAIRFGKPPVFYLNYRSFMEEVYDQRDISEGKHPYPTHCIDSRGQVQADGQMVFLGVRPGKVRIGQYKKPDDQAKEVDVPEGGEAIVKFPGHSAIANISGKLVTPEEIGAIDWSKQYGTMQPDFDPKPWPDGLTIEERSAWLKKNPEGKKLRSERPAYSVEIVAPGFYTILDVVPGKYTLLIPILTGGTQDKTRKLLGAFFEKLPIPTASEVNRTLAGGRLASGTSLNAEITPTFYRALAPGNQFPKFTAERLSTGEIDSPSLNGKKAIVIFYDSTPQFLAANDINATAAKAKADGIDVLCLNIDGEKAIAEKALRQYPLACPVAWAGNDEKLMKTFGPVWPPTVFSVNVDGTIRGIFPTAGEALKSLED